ncbi:hypothetical protein D3218_13145 [Aureimonas flava]|uniref:Tail fiber protein n=1 Tax=Aureimonas flava TaxID=2320271 RepID=A0A3A1WSC2_9HYPH|nr:hypothetical protein D3218_13145 [Aureimonas flava]
MKRFPTSDERQDGFDCGPADRELFDGLFHRIEAEIGEVIKYAGIEQTDTDLTQLRKAIQAIISTALPSDDGEEIDPTQFVLMAQARARLPIFPEINTSDGRITIVAAGTGTVRLPGGVTFTHRGIYPISTTQQDFPTAPSKVYHLRWTPGENFQLRDLSDTTVYNPGSLPETSPAFDSKYDDMLIARVITNSSNIATITPLANKNVLAGEFFNEFTFPQLRPGAVSDPILASAIDINWARTPMVSFGQMGANGTISLAGNVDFGVTGNINNFKRSETSRYNTKTALQAYNPGSQNATISAQYQIVARA